MTRAAVVPTSQERTFGEDEIIVSKTDPRGRITYANDVFLNVALYKEEEVLGQPHSIVRHPDMPRSVFRFLWERIESGHEIFAYVKNMAKNGDFYWVFAHVTPSFDGAGRIIGYHSNRRSPEPDAVRQVEQVYRQLLTEEKRHADRKQGLVAAGDLLSDMVAQAGGDYDRFVFSL